MRDVEKEPPIGNDKLYEQLEKAWLHYVVWREKIFAGYLAALAALGFAFSSQTSPAVRAGVFGFSFVVSIVFRILDFRTTELVNMCQRTGKNLEPGKGFYVGLQGLRFPEERRAWWCALFTKETLASYGFAINVLVASVVGASLSGLCIYLMKWLGRISEAKPCWAVIAVAVTIVVLVYLQWYTYRTWSRERDAYSSGSRGGT